MSRVLYTSLAAIALLFAGCSRPNVKELLQQCNELKEVNDPKSWQQICKNLDIVVANIDCEDEATLPIQNFHVMSLIRTADWSRAAEFADKLQEKYPNDFLANYQLGKVKTMQGSLKLTEAGDKGAAIREAKGDAAREKLMSEKNTCEREANEAYHQAYVYLEHAAEIEGEPTAKTLTLLLSAAEQIGAAGAEKYFKQAEEMPEFIRDPTFYNLWGLWLMKRGTEEQNRTRYHQAVGRLVEAAKLDDVSPKVFLNLAILWDKYLGNPKVARQYYMRHKARLAMNPATNTRERNVPVQRRLNEIRHR